MTPQEKAVIDAAIRWSRTETVGQSEDASDALQDEVAALIAARAPVPALTWTPATLGDCLAGDHIRIGTDETDVLRSSLGTWHADTRDEWRPRAWKHVELRMELAAVPGFVQYPPATPCEILCSLERAAVLALQSVFPGSSVDSPPVDK